MNRLQQVPLEDILPDVSSPPPPPTVQQQAGFDQPTKQETDKADASIFQQEKLLDNGDRWENVLEANIKAANIHR